MSDPVGWGSQWISDHAASGQVANKPVILEEFGVTVSDQASTYTAWYSTIISSGLAGDLIWYVSRAHVQVQRIPAPLGADGIPQASRFSLLHWSDARRRVCGMYAFRPYDWYMLSFEDRFIPTTRFTPLRRSMPLISRHGGRDHAHDALALYYTENEPWGCSRTGRSESTIPSFV